MATRAVIESSVRGPAFRTWSGCCGSWVLTLLRLPGGGRLQVVQVSAPTKHYQSSVPAPVTCGPLRGQCLLQERLRELIHGRRAVGAFRCFPRQDAPRSELRRGSTREVAAEMSGRRRARGALRRLHGSMSRSTHVDLPLVIRGGAGFPTRARPSTAPGGLRLQHAWWFLAARSTRSGGSVECDPPPCARARRPVPAAARRWATRPATCPRSSCDSTVTSARCSTARRQGARPGVTASLEDRCSRRCRGRRRPARGTRTERPRHHRRTAPADRLLHQVLWS